MENHQFTILNFDKIGSTNDLAFELIARNEARDHFIILANSQSKGRGREDRNWESPAGNIYLSLILQPENIAEITNYSFLAACVIGDILQSYNITTQYKWPNDIIFNDKKLAGILLQFQRINHINNLVIGIGVNLVSAPSYAISLQNYNISKEDFLRKFTEIFAKYEAQYQQFGFAPIRNKWKNNAYKIGQEIKLSNGMDGIFQDIDAEGNLLLLDKSGKINKISMAEILQN